MLQRRFDTARELQRERKGQGRVRFSEPPPRHVPDSSWRGSSVAGGFGFVDMMRSTTRRSAVTRLAMPDCLGTARQRLYGGVSMTGHLASVYGTITMMRVKEGSLRQIAPLGAQEDEAFVSPTSAQRTALVSLS